MNYEVVVESREYEVVIDTTVVASVVRETEIVVSTIGVLGPSGPRGEQGEQGPPGESGAFSDFTQTFSAAAEWVVNHNLGRKPLVAVSSTGGVEVEANVVHMSVNQLRVFFTVPLAGEVRCM